MARRKRHIIGRVYITNDNILVGGRGKKRRVVSMGNDKNNKVSGVEVKTFRKTIKGKPIQERYLHKTKTRLNKWNMKKISTKNRPKNKESK